MLNFLAQWLAIWNGYEQIVDELIDAGDRVVGLARQRAKGLESGAPAEMTFAQVVTVRNGRIVRIENYSDQAEALAAV